MAMLLERDVLPPMLGVGDQLRYSFGSLLVEADESIATVSRLMGHTNEAVTLGVYVHEVERRDGGERTHAAMASAFGPPSLRAGLATAVGATR